MKIAIITDYIDDYTGGINTYITNILKIIAVNKNKDKLFYSVHFKKNPVHKTFQNFEEVIVHRNGTPLGKIIRKFFVLPLILQKKKIDIVHDTYHFGPFLFPAKYKKIVTVHDITPIILSGYHQKLSIAYHKIIMYLILKHVDKIITVSNNTKTDLIKCFSIPGDKIKVIYLAADKIYYRRTNDEIIPIKKKYGLNSKIILYIGTLEPRKNVVGLIKSFHILKNLGLEHKLVIVGRKGWGYIEIFECVKKLNLQKDVIFLGYVPTEDLPAMYSMSDLFVYPSFYEGFGLPPLEAMACGCPVIASNTSSLPEVVGDAGIMIDPYNIDELSEAMYSVLINEMDRKDMIKKGLERAEMFSWKKTAEETLEVYEEVFNE
ncbi:D-inositol-3-phosphate glycosyltransferase [uncultured archaeon]|nr:D-inositol-3-phosphate glycosyltransferase [uncultured archaeon]